MTSDPDWRSLNRAMWDAKTPAHLRSPLYDVDGFRGGRSSLRGVEIADLGDVAGKDLVHLQCHIGLDTLSWARRGAQVTGLDFSEPAIAAARDLAAEIGVEARFVCSDLYGAPQALQGARFDIVYTGVGALCWLPDVERWAKVVSDLLRPGGQLYLFEFHPLEWTLADGSHGLGFGFDYFTPPDGHHGGGAVDYADAEPSDANATVQWNHGLGDVVTALVRAGLLIEDLREIDGSVIPSFAGMEQGEDGLYRFPPGRPSLPLMYVLRARSQA